MALISFTNMVVGFFVMMTVLFEAVTVPERVSGAMENGGKVPETVSGTLIGEVRNNIMMPATSMPESMGADGKPQAVVMTQKGTDVACRLSFDYAKCLEVPLDKTVAMPMCPFRMCGPGIVEADECATEEDTKPQARCSVQSFVTFRWECINHGKKEMMENKEVCNCEWVKVERDFLTETGPFTGPNKPCQPTGPMLPA